LPAASALERRSGRAFSCFFFCYYYQLKQLAKLLSPPTSPGYGLELLQKPRLQHFFQTPGYNSFFQKPGYQPKSGAKRRDTP
jgi:hypothetical protein